MKNGPKPLFLSQKTEILSCSECDCLKCLTCIMRQFALSVGLHLGAYAYPVPGVNDQGGHDNLCGFLFA